VYSAAAEVRPDPMNSPLVKQSYAARLREVWCFQQSQFDQLAILGMQLVSWLIEKKPKRVALIESPLGNTVPVQFLEALAKRRGLLVEIVQWNAPRNDRPRRGRTVEDAAAVCATETGETGDFDLVVLTDESLTGTRFLKLFEALIGPVGKDRLLPIAMFFPDSRRSDLAQHPSRARLVKALEAQAEHIGYTNCHATFSGQRRFRIDGGALAYWPSPVIWSDSGLIAGKRKVNLAFMLIDHFQDIIADLAERNSVYRPYLESAWAVNDRGQMFAFAPGLTQRFFESAARDLPLAEFRDQLWARAKERFPDDYTGNLEAMSRTGVEERYDWLRNAFLARVRKTKKKRPCRQRCTASQHVVRRSGALLLRPRPAATLMRPCTRSPSNETIRSVNGWLIQKMLSRVGERDRLNP
jgi:hypothetical protein